MCLDSCKLRCPFLLRVLANLELVLAQKLQLVSAMATAGGATSLRRKRR